MSIVLETQRLALRPPRAADIPHFTPLLGDFEVAKNLSTVPHPYTEEDGRAFIELTARAWSSGEDYMFAIQQRDGGDYLGTCGVHPARNWEIGYWIGRPYWGQGYATEAISGLVEFAFGEAKAQRLHAVWYYDNPASGRVLEKLGFAAHGHEERACLSRGAKVFCHKVQLTRAAYERRKDGR